MPCVFPQCLVFSVSGKQPCVPDFLGSGCRCWDYPTALSCSVRTIPKETGSPVSSIQIQGLGSYVQGKVCLSLCSAPSSGHDFQSHSHAGSKALRTHSEGMRLSQSGVMRLGPTSRLVG